MPVLSISTDPFKSKNKQRNHGGTATNRNVCNVVFILTALSTFSGTMDSPFVSKRHKTEMK